MFKISEFYLSTKLQAIRIQLEAFMPVAPAQQQFKAILKVHINSGPRRPYAEAIDDPDDDLPVALHYNIEILTGAIT